MKKLLAVALMAMGLMATSAKADPIGPDCGSCFGGIYTLEFVVVTPTEYLVRLLVDATGYNGGPATDFIRARSSPPRRYLLVVAGQHHRSGHGGFYPTSARQRLQRRERFRMRAVRRRIGHGRHDLVDFDIKVANATDWLLTAGREHQVNYDPHGHHVSEDITLQHNQTAAITIRRSRSRLS